MAKCAPSNAWYVLWLCIADPFCSGMSSSYLLMSAPAVLAGRWTSDLLETVFFQVLMAARHWSGICSSLSPIDPGDHLPWSCCMGAALLLPFIPAAVSTTNSVEATRPMLRSASLWEPRTRKCRRKNAKHLCQQAATAGTTF